METPRIEHPNPQYMRNHWENLNGKWEFEIDKSNSGKDRKLYNKKSLNNEIIVPFCPESILSGVSETDFLNSVWYKKEITIKNKNKLIFLHIGACDYLTTVYINGIEVGTHKGGYTPICFDITDYVDIGTNTIVINAIDENRNGVQPSGKQSRLCYSHNCDYTRTTGIWQTVWLEYIPKIHINKFKIYPDYANGTVRLQLSVVGNADLSVNVYYENKIVGHEKVKICGNNIYVTIKLSEIHLWEVGAGRLYDLELIYGEDVVYSYFGLRNVSLEGYKFKLNGKTVFQRMVLDQGYYIDGIYTAPSDEALLNDIKLSLSAGFNGARLHQKVFEPRFLYYCDKMGYMVWEEYANWGLDVSTLDALTIMLDEWLETMERDFNHPSIIGWIPLNETWDYESKYYGFVPANRKVIESIYKVTKLMDNTRPCIDTSGGFHVYTDVFDTHDYEQDVDKFTTMMHELQNDDILNDSINRNEGWKWRQKYRGEPVFVSEYGGIKWDAENDNKAWGYGDAPETKEEFIQRYKGLTEAIMKNTKTIGFCYTQLYDVEQERNGLYTYSRQPKFDMNVFKKINTQPADNEVELI